MDLLDEFVDEKPMSMSMKAAQDEQMQLGRENQTQRKWKPDKADFFDDLFWEDYKLKTDPISRTIFLVHLVLSSSKFDAAIGFVIFVNSIAIGVQVEFELAGKDTSYLMLLDNIFLFIYAIELGLRFVAYGFVCLTSGRLSLF